MLGDASRYTKELEFHDLVRQAKLSRASLIGSTRIFADNVFWCIALHCRLAWYRLTATNARRDLEREKLRLALRRCDQPDRFD